MAPKEPSREIKTERLLIRPLREEDVEDIFAIRSSPIAVEFSSHLADTDIEQTKKWLASCLERDNCYNYVAELLDNSVSIADNGGEEEASSGRKNRVIGIIGAIRTPEIGYCLHPDAWGKGFATEALRAYMPLYWEHVSGRYDYAKALVDAEHNASRKILMKLGFVEYDYKVKNFDSPHHGLVDTVYYRILRPGVSLENAKGWSNESQG